LGRANNRCDDRERAVRSQQQVKPPNDVYVGGRKVAGVLLELRAVPAAPNVGILGIGVNVSHTADDFPQKSARPQHHFARSGKPSIAMRSRSASSAISIAHTQARSRVTEL
jgi:biotin-(acetyl-CoA carboxylase) ligase